MTTTDINDLTYIELNELRIIAADRMKEMRETGVEQLRLKFIEDAAALGLAPEDVFNAPKKAKRKRRPKDDDS